MEEVKKAVERGTVRHGWTSGCNEKRWLLVIASKLVGGCTGGTDLDLGHLGPVLVVCGVIGTVVIGALEVTAHVALGVVLFTCWGWVDEKEAV